MDKLTWTESSGPVEEYTDEEVEIVIQIDIQQVVVSILPNLPTFVYKNATLE